MSERVEVDLSAEAALGAEVLRNELRLAGLSAGMPAPRGVVALLSSAVRHWRSPSQAAVTRMVAANLRAVGFEDAADRAREAVEFAVVIGEVERCTIEGRSHLLPPLPRLVWVSPGERCFAVGGDPRVPPGETLPQRWCAAGAVRWIVPEAGDLDEQIARHGMTERSLDGWLGRPGWAPLVARRADRLASELSLLWQSIERALGAEAPPIHDPDQVRLIGGAPGDFFGGTAPDAIENSVGRWLRTRDLGPGVYLGARPSHGRRWLPSAFSWDGAGALRHIDLWGWEEFSWALLSRGAALGVMERIVRDKGTSHTRTFPAPMQLDRLLQVLTSPDAERAWSFQILPGLQGALVEAATGMGVEIAA